MKKFTVLAASAGALALVGVSAIASYSSAEPRGSWEGHHGGRHMKGHQEMKHHGMRHGKMGHGRGHRGPGIKYLLERFDSDKDGKLTQDELNKARETLLAKHDADKDGELTIAEFEQLWLEVMRKRMVRQFQFIDEDGSAKITLGEFLKPYEDAVERADRNGDGVLDKDDRGRRWGKRWHDRAKDDASGSDAEKDNN